MAGVVEAKIAARASGARSNFCDSPPWALGPGPPHGAPWAPGASFWSSGALPMGPGALGVALGCPGVPWGALGASAGPTFFLRWADFNFFGLGAGPSLIWFLGGFRADLSSKFEFCLNNCIGTLVQTVFSSFFEIRLFYKSSFWLFFHF